MLRGEIWWAKLHKPRKSEPGFKRPILILQTDSFNKSKIKTVICGVITSNIELAKAPGNILIGKRVSHLPKESVINLSQIITIDKSYLIEYVSTLNKKIVEQVNDGLKLVFDLL